MNVTPLITPGCLTIAVHLGSGKIRAARGGRFCVRRAEVQPGCTVVPTYQPADRRWGFVVPAME